MQQQLITMLELQNTMNQKVHPQWQNQNFEWYRAIWIECGELMDHYGWKWWKKQAPDCDQVLLELIDIWHFGLSSLLERHEGGLESLATKISIELQQNSKPENFLQDVESFATQVLVDKQFSTPKFATLMAGMDLSFDELYRQYIGKNILNMFRQDHGYKSGEYQKIWNGKEDNEHLVEVLNSLNIASVLFKEEVYSALKARYAVL